MALNPRFSRREAVAIFRRFKAGERLTDIGQSLLCRPAVIFNLMSRYGGIEPKERVRPGKALTASEREEISRGLSSGESFRCIARRLNRQPSTVFREVEKNGGRDEYRARLAEQNAWDRRQRPKSCKLQRNRELAARVTKLLEDDYSPQQISNELKAEFPNAPEHHVSHETIYRTLFFQARGALKKELIKHLRRAKTMRSPRQKNKPTRDAAIPDLISISQRPAEVEDRAVPGHWEGDLIAGYRNRSHIATLVERKTRFVKLVKVESKEATHVAASLTREVVHLPRELRRSLTWDRGTEMARHKEFTVATDVKVYFCDPHSPWQRGSNENTNGLLRQYFPKGMDLSGISQEELDAVANKLNRRPRMTLGWKSPAYRLNEAVALTG
jgi:IS30 family transposase